jgi:hypothetical protein
MAENTTKRKPGRPKGSKNKAAPSPAPAQEKKKRGRPPGTGARFPKKIYADQVRDPETGTLTSKDLFKAKECSPAGFRAWCKAIQPVVLNKAGKYEVFAPTAHQDDLVDKFLQSRKGSRSKAFQHNLVLNIEPRRHGKSTLFMLVVLWLWHTRENFTVQALGNEESHSRRTQYNRLIKTVENTAKLKAQADAGKIVIQKSEITRYAKGGRPVSVIQSMKGLTSASSFGDRVNVLWVSDLHACPDMAVFNAWQASLMDSENTLILVDSNVDSFGGPVHSLQEVAEAAPDMACNHLEYIDWDDYEKNAPAWIDRKKAKALEKTLLPAEFQRDILGIRGQSVNHLFNAEIIQGMQEQYPLPVSVESLEKLTVGREFYIGGGLDRAKNLIQTKISDASVWTVTLKIQDPGKEARYVTLNQKTFRVNSEKLIMAQILKDHDRYGLTNVVLENYETAGLYHRLVERGLSVELITANAGNKNISVPEFYRICSEGRFTASHLQAEFFKELSGYIYERNNNGTYKFTHAKHLAHDDHIDSTVWSVYALREMINSMFILDAVVCENRNPSARTLCFLFGGDHVLNSCSMRCPAYHQTHEFHQAYLRQQPDSDISLVEFFHSLVKTEMKTYQL